MTAGPELFRQEAVEHHTQGRTSHGDVLRVSPAWTRWFYWLIVAIGVAALAFALIGTVAQYAEGPAVVSVDGHLDLTASQPGIVASVDVGPRQRVTRGQPLVRFNDALEAVELERARRDFEVRLIQLLSDPGDAAARKALAVLRSEIDYAEARLGQRVLRAPQAGFVNDLRVRPGQKVTAGEVVLTFVGDDAHVTILAMLPGHFRPMLAPGGPLRLDLSGYPYTGLELVVDSIDDEVIGPREVRRYLGEAIADAVPLHGPMVLVRARTPGDAFEFGGRAYPFHDGMHGRARVRVREDSVLTTLVPGLGALFRRNDE